MLTDVNHYDVIIVGGGPAGCTAALKLAPSGLRIALLDKSSLPKEKVCGDALSGTVMKVLKGMPDNAFSDFLRLPGILPSWGISFVAPNQMSLDVPFLPVRDVSLQAPGVTCPRMVFEDFLIRQLGKCSNISLFPRFNVREICLTPASDRVIVTGEQFRLTSEVIIGADGTNSTVGKELAGNRLNPKNICLGARGYYEGVSGLHPENFLELHFIRELLPNYLWIFPMQGNITNVGLGLMPSQVKKCGSSPARMLEEILHSHPVLKDRFAHATLLGKIGTHGLPMGPDHKRISGNRFLLTGDAASVIDPFTGEGIGNAMVSAEIAAKVIESAFLKKDFSGNFFSAYDSEIQRRIGRELRVSKTLRKLAGFPGLFNFVIKKANSRKDLKDLLSLMYTDLEARKKLMSPAFYLTMVMDPLKRSSSYKP